MDVPPHPMYVLRIPFESSIIDSRKKTCLSSNHNKSIFPKTRTKSMGMKLYLFISISMFISHGLMITIAIMHIVSQSLPATVDDTSFNSHTKLVYTET